MKVEHDDVFGVYTQCAWCDFESALFSFETLFLHTVSRQKGQICQKLVEILNQICKKETWEGVGEGSQTPNDPWAGSNSQDDENHGSWTPLGTLRGASFESPTRPRSVAEGVLTKSQMRIARKCDA